MADAPKMTTPQRILLRRIAESTEAVYELYRPAHKLVEYGYAQWEEGRYGAALLRITPAGLAAIAKERTGSLADTDMREGG